MNICAEGRVFYQFLGSVSSFARGPVVFGSSSYAPAQRLSNRVFPRVVGMRWYVIDAFVAVIIVGCLLVMLVGTPLLKQILDVKARFSARLSLLRSCMGEVRLIYTDGIRSPAEYFSQKTAYNSSLASCPIILP